MQLKLPVNSARRVRQRYSSKLCDLSRRRYLFQVQTDLQISRKQLCPGLLRLCDEHLRIQMRHLSSLPHQHRRPVHRRHQLPHLRSRGLRIMRFRFHPSERRMSGHSRVVRAGQHSQRHVRAVQTRFRAGGIQMRGESSVDSALLAVPE